MFHRLKLPVQQLTVLKRIVSFIFARKSMRGIITFFLSLCFLLLRGYDHVYAHADHNRICYSATQVPQKDKQVFPGIEKSRSFLQDADGGDTEQDSLQATEREEDDDDGNSSRKLIELYCFFSAFYKIDNPFLQQQQQSLAFCGRSTYPPFGIYILQRSIRV